MLKIAYHFVFLFKFKIIIASIITALASTKYINTTISILLFVNISHIFSCVCAKNIIKVMDTKLVIIYRLLTSILLRHRHHNHHINIIIIILLNQLKIKMKFIPTTTKYSFKFEKKCLCMNETWVRFNKFKYKSPDDIYVRLRFNVD